MSAVRPFEIGVFTLLLNVLPQCRSPETTRNPMAGWA